MRGHGAALVCGAILFGAGLTALTSCTAGGDAAGNAELREARPPAPVRAVAIGTREFAVDSAGTPIGRLVTRVDTSAGEVLLRDELTIARRGRDSLRAVATAILDPDHASRRFTLGVAGGALPLTLRAERGGDGMLGVTITSGDAPGLPQGVPLGSDVIPPQALPLVLGTAALGNGAVHDVNMFDPRALDVRRISVKAQGMLFGAQPVRGAGAPGAADSAWVLSGVLPEGEFSLLVSRGRLIGGRIGDYGLLLVRTIGDR